jgi:hypothetical protein
MGHLDGSSVVSGIVIRVFAVFAVIIAVAIGIGL